MFQLAKRVTLLSILGACALATFTVSGALAAGPDKSALNKYATGEDPVRLATRCASLDDAAKREQMDGLLTELIYVCGRFDLIDEIGEESEESELEGQAPFASTDAIVNNITGESGSRVQNETALAFNETSGTVCSGFNDSYSGVTLAANFTGFSRSTDGGATWADGGQLAPPAGQRSFGDPAIVWRKSDGKFYMAALHSSGGLGFWRSDDDCVTFTWVGLASPNSQDDKELLSVDNTPASPFYGRIYLGWTDFAIAGTAEVERHTTDGGASWSAQHTISFGGAPQGAWPAVAPNGNAYMAWVDRASNAVISIQVVRSTNGGVTWAPVANHPAVGVVNPRDAAASGTCGRTALNANIRYLPSPQLVVGPDNVLHVVYSRDPNAQGSGDTVDVYYRRSTDSGDTWSTEHRLNDDATTTDQFFPSIAIGSTNIVGAGWYDRREDASNIRINYYSATSFDGGLTWQANVKISDVDSPVVSSNPGLATCYHGDYDTHVQTLTHIVRQWADDRPDASGDNANTYVDVEAISSDFLVLSGDPVESICAGTSAVYPISVPQFQGFTEQVTLSATGNPAPTTTGFSPNPVTPPGASTLTIGNTGGAPFGNSVITVTGTSSPGGIVHTANLQLKVYTNAPNAPTLSLPADGATDVSIKPVLDWSTLTQAIGYDLDVATDAGFTNIVYTQSNVSGSTHTVLTPLVTETEYFWRVRGTNVCGTGNYAAPFSFTTRGLPPTLLVDDDDNGPDVQGTYATGVNGISDFDLWDVTAEAGEPTLADLTPYKLIIWFSGDRFTGESAPTAGPQSATEAALGTFLDGGQGRCVFISSQDYLWDMGGAGHNVPTSFMQNYLGVAAAGNSSDNGDYTSVTGQNIFSGIGPSALSYPFSDFSDRLAVGTGAQSAFVGNNAFTGGVSKSFAASKAFWLAFPWEAMAVADRNAVFTRLYENCSGEIFSDGFEAENMDAWTSHVP